MTYGNQSHLFVHLPWPGRGTRATPRPLHVPWTITSIRPNCLNCPGMWLQSSPHTPVTSTPDRWPGMLLPQSAEVPPIWWPSSRRCTNPITSLCLPPHTRRTPPRWARSRWTMKPSRILDAHFKELLGYGLARVANDQEHSLEIELPFCSEHLCTDFKLLPVMVRAPIV